MKKKKNPIKPFAAAVAVGVSREQQSVRMETNTMFQVDDQWKPSWIPRLF